MVESDGARPDDPEKQVTNGDLKGDKVIENNEERPCCCACCSCCTCVNFLKVLLLILLTPIILALIIVTIAVWIVILPLMCLSPCCSPCLTGLGKLVKWITNLPIRFIRWLFDTPEPVDDKERLVEMKDKSEYGSVGSDDSHEHIKTKKSGVKPK
ncbi:unnamed protein product [Owenia fusiformis]|uniref:Uncharacterized protein n=1 Tax=Owenia fusiformis TaxID=6347 RepID=A0A8J1XZI3_OWEFU|nr:unnamed protein product [Owenia fusiformis]